MANEWQTVRVEDIAEKIAMGPFGSNIKVETFVETGVPVISGAHLRGVRLEDGVFNFVTNEHAERMKNSNVFRGDVIFTHAGNIGQVSYIPPDSRYERYVISQRQFYLRCDLSKAEPDFVSYFFHSKEGQHKLLANASQTGVPSIARPSSYLKTIELSLPPLPEQRAIAHILGTLDDKIELNRKQNETLEAMARALFKAWFVDFEPVRAKMEGRWQRGQSLPGLPEHLYDVFPDQLHESKLGEIPLGWHALPVYDIAAYVNGAAFKAFQPNEERRGLPIVKIAELKAGVTAQTKFSDVAMPEKYRLRTGDILFSWSGNPDTSIDTFIWPHGDAWLNQHIFRVDIRNPGERAFVIATLKYLRPVFAELARNKQTTGLGHVTVGDMQRLLVVKPDKQGLDAWDRVAGPIFSAVFRNELNSISLGKLRDTLLPKLISGELRVPDAERIIGAAV